MAADSGSTKTMTEDECWEMLDTTTVGRVAFVHADELIVLPVNYRHSRGGILFRTSPTSQLAALIDHSGDVVFEVDHHEELYQTGWSVVVLGNSRAADPDKDITSDDAERLRAWASGDRALLIRIEPRSVTGRRVELD